MPRGPAEGRGEGGSALTGRHVVYEALRARRRHLRGIRLRAGARGGELDALLAEAERVGVPVEEMDAVAFDRRAPESGNPQGVILDAGPLPEPLLDELVPEAGPCCLVALDGVEDPQNLGAIARVAEASGAAGLILGRRRSPPLSAAASRASAGALEWLPVARVPNLGQAINSLKQKDFWVFGADGEASEGLFDLDARTLSERRVVVLGAEGRGLRKGILDELDHRVGIPMRGQVGSLNVATAAAVVLYELARRDAGGAGA